MKRMLKTFTALLLCLSMVTGLLPAGLIGEWVALASEAAETQQANEQALERRMEVLCADFESVALKAQAMEPSDDGEWRYVLVDGYAVIVGHHDRGEADLEIPRTLGGADVVALDGRVFAGHDALMNLTMTGNVYYAGAHILPRGVNVRGYNGSYASRWAEENRFSFENLSEVDFVKGVADLSDVLPEHFVRQSAASVRLRALEACRLAEGVVFFLADPLNPYAISYYRVASLNEEEDGFVTVSCQTPDVTQVVRSFSFENQTMMPDWSTIQLEENAGAKGPLIPRGQSGKATAKIGFDFHPEAKLGSKGKWSFDVGYTGSYTASANYANLTLKTFEVVATEEFSIGGTLSYTNTFTELGSDELDEATDERIKELLKQSKGVSSVQTESVKVDQKLCSVTLFTLWGFMTANVEIGFKVEFSGEVAVHASYTTETTYTYSGGELKSKTVKKGQNLTLEANAEIKAGGVVGLKLYLFAYNIGFIELFAGIKGTAEYKLDNRASDPMDQAYWPDPSLEAVNDAFVKGKLDLAYLNTLDCVELKVSLLIEVSFELGGKHLTLVSGSVTLLDWQLAHYHFHFWPFKYVSVGGALGYFAKEEGDRFHKAAECPLMDALMLMVPSINRADPLGTHILHGESILRKEPELVLPDYGVRVSDWYFDQKLTSPLLLPHSFNSGDRIWGDTEKVTVARFINFDGEPLKDVFGKDAVSYLAEGESLQTSGLNLEDQKHIVGWVEVKSSTDLTFAGDIVWNEELKLTGDGKDHVYLAIVDNDITITFKDSDNHILSTMVTGHFIPIPAEHESIPAFPVLYDPSYAVATYEWRDLDGSVYTFPLTPDQTVPKHLTLRMVPTGIERVYAEDDSETLLSGGIRTGTEGLDVFSASAFYTYSEYSDHIVINAFQPTQTYEDAEGNLQTWTAEPEALVIPAYINDKPVTAIASSAMDQLDTLVYVSLPDTITSIGSSAFANNPNLKTLDLSACVNLTSIPASMAEHCPALAWAAFPSSVTQIGTNAFRDCTSLTSAQINASLGSGAFMGCTALSSIDLLFGVKSIGASAFEDTAITSLTVPCSVETVGNNFIYGCTSLKELTMDGAPEQLTARILQIGPGSSLEKVELGLGVMSVGANALSNGSNGNPSLTTVIFPEALREMGSGVLAGTAVEKVKVFDLSMLGAGFAQSCTTLREIEFEKGIVSPNAFRYCTALEKVVLGDSVYAIGQYAFSDCTSLKEISIGSGVESIGQNAFDGCTALERVTLSEGLKSIGNRAFDSCHSLKEISFPESVESFGQEMLRYCRSLEKITIGGENMPVLDGWKWFGMLFTNSSASDSSLKSVVIREGVREIGEKSFANPASQSSTTGYYGHPQLTHVQLPSTLETIGRQAFAYCDALGSLALPSSLKTIGDHAFKDCSSMVLLCPENLNLHSIGMYAFDGCSAMTGINLGRELISIGDHAFNACHSLKEISFPESMENYGQEMLRYCRSLEKITIGGDNTPVLDGWKWFGMLFTNSSASDSSLKSVVIREGVREIGEKSFANPASQSSTTGYYGHPQLTHVQLPSTLETIGRQAFAYCDALGELVLPSSLKTIGDYAFKDCSSMVLTCPEELNLHFIGMCAFDGCSAMTGINLGSELISIGDHAFNACHSLKEISFPESMENFGQEMLRYCRSLEKITIGGPKTPVLDGWKWFGMLFTNSSASDSSLKTVIIREGVTEIGEKSFANPAGQSSTSGYFGHPDLTHVELPSTLETIGRQAFAYCDALGTLALPSGLKVIGDYAFTNCHSLNLSCPQDLSLHTIGQYAFNECHALNSINLGSKLRYVGNCAFNSCTSLREIAFPPSVETFGQEVLRYCSSLETLVIGGPKTPVLDGRQWIGCLKQESALKTLILSEGVTELANRCFANPAGADSSNWYGFPHLQNISLPSTLRVISDLAFSHSIALTSVRLPDALTSLSDGNPFQSCAALTTLTSCTYNSVIADFAAAMELDYTWNVSSAMPLTLAGETLMVDVNAELAPVLSGHVPEAPEGFVFDGWYQDAACTLPWQQPVMPAFALTLYPGFVPQEEARFIGLYHGEIVYESVFTAGRGHDVPWPQEPEVDGLRFEGWYLDEACSDEPFLSCAMPEDGLTVYGRFRASNAGAIYSAVEGGVELVRLVLTEGESTTVWLPDMVNGQKLVSIAPNAFDDAAAMTVLHLPDHLENVSSETFCALQNLTQITTSPRSEHFRAVSGVLYTADLKTLVCFPRSKPAVNLHVPDGVETIASYAAQNAKWLERIVLPDSTDTLGDYAFAGCSLKELRAWGLETIGENAIPAMGELQVYGPVKTGALREYLIASDEYDSFLVPYNVYDVSLYVNGGLISTIGLEAGSTLPYEFCSGEMDDGTVITTWFADASFTIPWGSGQTTPEAAISLYASALPIYVWEEAAFTVDGVQEQGIRLTAYNGMGGDLVLPEEMGGLPVRGLGEAFLASANGMVASIQIPACVTEIASTALNGPFSGTVRADQGSCAAQWAEENGFTLLDGLYSLSFETNGGSAIALRTLARGVSVRLPQPILSGCTFAGWYLDEALTEAVSLEDDCFVMPGADTKLYAGWNGTAQVWPFDYAEVSGGLVITAYTGTETDIVLPDSINGLNVTGISSGAFTGTAVQTIHLPAFAADVSASAFDGCEDLVSITVDEGNALYTSVNGVLIKDNLLVRYPEGLTASAYTLPEGVSIIGEGAFRNAAYLQRIEGNWLALGAYAFANCTSLVSFDCGRVSKISRSAFINCANLENVSIAANTTAIESGAFLGCTSLKSVSIPDSVVSIGTLAFTDGVTLYGSYGTEAYRYARSNGLAFVNPDAAEPTALTINVASAWTLGDLIPLNAAAMPEDAVLYEGVVWTASDENILRINGDTAYACGGGRVILTATASNGVTGRKELFIRIPAQSILLPQSVWIPLGGQLQLQAQCVPASSTDEILWRSDDETVLHVDETGLATAAGSGVATVTAYSAQGISASCTVYAGNYVHLSASRLILEPGQRVVLTGVGAPLNGCTWSVSDEAVVTVANGMVNALAQGSSSISCTLHEGFTLTAEVTVKEDAAILILPAALRSLESESFAGMPQLEQIVLPGALESIAPDAFAGCELAVLMVKDDSYACQWAQENDVPHVLVVE